MASRTKSFDIKVKIEDDPINNFAQRMKNKLFNDKDEDDYYSDNIDEKLLTENNDEIGGNTDKSVVNKIKFDMLSEVEKIEILSRAATEKKNKKIAQLKAENRQICEANKIQVTGLQAKLKKLVTEKNSLKNMLEKKSQRDESDFNSLEAELKHLQERFGQEERNNTDLRHELEVTEKKLEDQINKCKTLEAQTRKVVSIFLGKFNDGSKPDSMNTLKEALKHSKFSTDTKISREEPDDTDTTESKVKNLETKDAENYKRYNMNPKVDIIKISTAGRFIVSGGKITSTMNDPKLLNNGSENEKGQKSKTLTKHKLTDKKFKGSNIGKVSSIIEIPDDPPNDPPNDTMYDPSNWKIMKNKTPAKRKLTEMSTNSLDIVPGDKKRRKIKTHTTGYLTEKTKDASTMEIPFDHKPNESTNIKEVNKKNLTKKLVKDVLASKSSTKEDLIGEANISYIIGNCNESEVDERILSKNVSEKDNENEYFADSDESKDMLDSISISNQNILSKLNKSAVSVISNLNLSLSHAKNVSTNLGDFEDKNITENPPGIIRSPGSSEIKENVPKSLIIMSTLFSDDKLDNGKSLNKNSEDQLKEKPVSNFSEQVKAKKSNDTKPKAMNFLNIRGLTINKSGQYSVPEEDTENNEREVIKGPVEAFRGLSGLNLQTDDLNRTKPRSTKKKLPTIDFRNNASLSMSVFDDDTSAKSKMPTIEDKTSSKLSIIPRSISLNKADHKSFDDENFQNSEFLALEHCTESQATEEGTSRKKNSFPSTISLTNIDIAQPVVDEENSSEEDSANALAPFDLNLQRITYEENAADLDFMEMEMKEQEKNDKEKIDKEKNPEQEKQTNFHDGEIPESIDSFQTKGQTWKQTKEEFNVDKAFFDEEVDGPDDKVDVPEEELDVHGEYSNTLDDESDIPEGELAMDLDLEKYDLLINKINNQLESISEQNRQMEEKQKEIEVENNKIIVE